MNLRDVLFGLFLGLLMFAVSLAYAAFRGPDQHTVELRLAADCQAQYGLIPSWCLPADALPGPLASPTDTLNYAPGGSL